MEEGGQSVLTWATRLRISGVRGVGVCGCDWCVGVRAAFASISMNSERDCLPNPAKIQSSSFFVRHYTV